MGLYSTVETIAIRLELGVAEVREKPMVVLVVEQPVLLVLWAFVVDGVVNLGHVEALVPEVLFDEFVRAGQVQSIRDANE